MYVQRMKKNCALVVELVCLLQSQRMEASIGLISKYAQLNMYDNSDFIFAAKKYTFVQ